MISGVNTDLLSKIGTGSPKKGAPAAKLGKTSTGPEALPSAGGAFAEQLGLAGRAPAARSPETSEKNAAPVSGRSQVSDQRNDREETPVNRGEHEETAPTPAEDRPLAPRLKKTSTSLKEQSGIEANAPVDARMAPGLAPVPVLQPTEPEFFAEDETVQQPQTAGVDLAPLRQAVPLKAAVKADEPANVFEQVSAEQGQVRRQAMQDFMNHMQREFGIPPEKIVDAFSRLDEEALMRPPEESTKQFLANLEVPLSQTARAAELYNTMVRTTGEAALNEKLAGAEQGVKMTVMSPRDEALRKLNEAIDQLNNAFALRGQQGQVTSLAAPLDNPLKAQLALEQMNSELAKMERTNRAMQPQTDEGDDTLMAVLPENMTSDSGPTATPLMAGALAMPFASGSGGEASSSMSQQFGRGDGGRSPSQQTEVNFQAQMKKTAAPGENAKSAGKKASAESVAAGADSQVANADASLAGAEAQNTTATGAAKVAGPAGMMIQRPTPTAQDEQANVKELIRQAQLAIKNGGGEIKMDLKPEGIGQLHLKVSVENGQVNVQMLTDNDASKRLLEKGLHELKSNLAAHELKVDTLKVDVGQELKKHMDNSGDQAREQTRQFAADVMSQFREERQGFRDGFMQNQGWRQFGRNYGSPAETGRAGSGSPNTEAAASAGQRARARSAYSNGRLDLVA